MEYKILKKQNFSDGKYSLVPLRKKDIFKIARWRNEQLGCLRQKKKLTKKDQKDYFQNKVYPTFSERWPEMMLFSFLLAGQCIGYGGLVHFDWQAKRAEVSFLAETSRSKNKKIYLRDFSQYLKLVKETAFKDLKLNRIFTETFASRSSAHIKTLGKAGFRLEGTMRQHVKIGNQYVDSLIHGLLRKDYV